MVTLEDLMAELTPDDRAKVEARSEEMLKEYEDRIKAKKLGSKKHRQGVNDD